MDNSNMFDEMNKLKSLHNMHSGLPDGEEGLRLTRIDVRIPVTYTWKGVQADGTVVNISSGGVGIEVKQIFVVGDIIRVQFKLKTEKMNDDVDFWGIVRNVNNGQIGVKFEELSNENREKLEDYVGELLRERGLSQRESY